MRSTPVSKAISKHKRIIVLGPPGSGKGTQCKRLEQALGIPHLSMGDLLRGHVTSRTKSGKNLNEIMNRGELVSDELVTEILRDRVSRADCSGGFILDGFPRTEKQAQLLEILFQEAGWNQNGSIWFFRLVVPESVIIQRIADRRSCSSCGKTFDRGALESKLGTRCDIDGSPLFVREDDQEVTVRNRFDVFNQMMRGISTYYSGKRQIIEVNADRNLNDVSDSLLAVIGS